MVRPNLKSLVEFSGNYHPSDARLVEEKFSQRDTLWALVMKVVKGSGAVEAEYWFRPEVSTADGKIIVHPRPRALSEEEEVWLREYLKGHPQKSSEERMTEEEQAEETRRAELVACIAKVTDSNEVSIPAKQVRGAIRALAQLTGVEL